MTDARDQLLDLLDRKAFEPVLHADADRFHSQKQKAELKDAQAATRSTRMRYRKDYTSASDVKTNFQRDLSSDSARKVQKEIEDLGLPTLRDVKPEFEALAEKLGVR